MIVLKFGGSSVQNGDRIRKALNIALSQIERAPVLVSSAIGKTTNTIESIIEYAVAGEKDKAFDLADSIKSEHINIASQILSAGILELTISEISELMCQFSSFVKGLSLLHECSPRSRDALLSFGELLSTKIIAACAAEQGINSELLDSRDFIKTDENFNAAMPDLIETEKMVKQNVFPISGKLLVAQGFISSTFNGVTSTLGRGGSDYTATLIGSALSAEEVQIWTDVDGIMTTDPRVVSGAKTIKSITYSEAGELAFFGAKVVHPATIQPAVRQRIPVLVKNSLNPDSVGTAILPVVKDKGVKASGAAFMK